jgi:polysaccharide biosynthesis transport protein
VKSSVNSSQQKPNDTFGSDVRSAIGLLREKWWLIFLSGIGAGIAGAVYIALSPDIYRAQTVIQVEQGEQKIFKSDGTDAHDLNWEEILKTTEQSLTSSELLLAVIKQNHLDRDPSFLPALKRPASDTALAEALAIHISTQLRRDTRLIDITVEDQKAARAQKIAELLVTEYIHENFSRQLEASEMAYDFLRQQAERLKSKVAESEQTLQAYKDQHQEVALMDKANPGVEKLTTLNRMLTEAKASRLKLEADRSQIKMLKNSPPAALLAIPSVASSPAVVELEKNITVKQAEVASLAGHPSHFAAMAQLQEMKAALDRLVLNAAQEVTTAYDSALAMEKKMEEVLQEQESVTLATDKILIPYNALRQEAESDRAFYESVLARLRESDVTKTLTQNTIRVVSHPLPPERPVSPNKKRIMLLSVFGGLALGCGLSLLSRALDRSLRSVEEAERLLRVPALGAIPKWARPKRMGDDLLMIEQPGTVVAESFRSLRTSLSLLGERVGHQTFLFTSALVSEGKSFCAVNCAAAFAQQGLKTLLIDADLRSPSIGKIFFDRASVPGLAEILIHQVDLNDVVHPTNIENLSVLCAGTQLNSPAELLGGKAMAGLITLARTQFDSVVIDSAPIQAVSDTLLLVAQVHTTCLVASAKTSCEVAMEAVLKIANSNAARIGFILNRVSQQRCDQEYNYGYAFKPGDRVAAGHLKRPKKSTPQLTGPALRDL